MQPLQLATVILLLVISNMKGQNIKASSCGRRLIDHNALITEGFRTSHWPWHAAVYHQLNKPLPEYKCGGTLINENSVLTAAHCTSQNNKPLAPSIVSVSLGRLNLDVDESSAQSSEVAEIFQHPNFSSIDLVHDIAVIRLLTDATFDNYVRPICLWNANKTELTEVVGREGTVIGWGVTETGEASNVLQQAFMPVVSLGICLKSNRYFFGAFLSDTNFCAGSRNGTRTCNGDSGGSMTFEENGLFYIRGIVSLGVAVEDKKTGRRSCDAKQFAIFTDVAKYLPWIKEVASELTNECEIDVQCKRTLMNLHKCEIDLHIKLSERKCKIIFNETTSTNVTWLIIRRELEALPDLSDALKKFENLQNLVVTQNKLQVVERSKLTAFRKIELLTFGFNKITQLASDTFDDLENLTHLGLHMNRLKEIDRDLFRELRRLKVLWLYKNQLEILPQNLFRNNKKLEKIDVQNNKIKEIHEELFNELRELKVLWLNGNQLEVLPSNLFRNNEKLEEISIRDNKIKEIDGEVFSELRELKNLLLNDNQLEILPQDLFRNNLRLEQIQLNNNKIKTIETDFQHLPNLVELYLSGNVCIDELCDVKSFCGTDSTIQMQKKIWKRC